MQVLHPSIVRCIAFTKESPWITIFPFYNGGSLGDTLLKVPFRFSEFTRAIFRLDRGWRHPPPDNNVLSHLELSKIKQIVMTMPHIMHALVEGLAAAHVAGIVHTDLHPFNGVGLYKRVEATHRYHLLGITAESAQKMSVSQFCI